MAENQLSSWLNIDLLQEILKDNGKNIIIEQFNRSDASEKGDSYLSNMTRCKVEYKLAEERKSQEVSLIIKTVPSNDKVGEFVGSLSAFSIEMRIFSETLPKIYNELQKIGKLQEIAAKFYYCHFYVPKMLVVEDLSVKGFKMADRKKGLDLDHSILVMKTLARFHAGSAVLHQNDPKSIESYESNFHTEDQTKQYLEHYYINMAEAIAKVAEDIFPNEKSYPDRIKQRGRTMRRDHSQLLVPKSISFNCLTHGDLWLNNMMFQYDDVTRDVKDVRFVDFQFCKYAPAPIDLQYFINSSPTEHVRINETENLLKTYHEELCETLESSEYRGKIFSFQEFVQDYERYDLYGYFTSVYVLPIFLADQSDAFEWEELLKKVDDFNGHLKRISNPLNIPVFKRLLPIYAEKGIF